MTTPAQPAAYVELTEAAVQDLQDLADKAPVVLAWALKKMILLENNPYAGEPLGGVLAGWRKLVVGDRGWRIIWRVTQDLASTDVIEIAEVWAVGVRAESQVYAEMRSRVSEMRPGPQTTALSDIIERLGRMAAGVEAAGRPQPREPIPEWLIQRLVRAVGMEPADVERLSLQEAVDVWTDWCSKPR